MKRARIDVSHETVAMAIIRRSNREGRIKITPWVQEHRNQTKNQLHATQLTTSVPDPLLAGLQQAIAKVQIVSLRQQVRDLTATRWTTPTHLRSAHQHHRHHRRQCRPKSPVMPLLPAYHPFIRLLWAPHTTTSTSRAYYHHLIKTRGPRKLQAICAVMR